MENEDSSMENEDSSMILQQKLTIVLLNNVIFRWAQVGRLALVSPTLLLRKIIATVPPPVNMYT